MRSITVLLTLFSFVFLSTGCSMFGDNEGTSKRAQSSLSAPALYQKAQQSLEKKRYVTAIETLKIIEAQYPFTPEATQAQLDIIFAQYKMGESTDAAIAAKRFLSLHPRHPKADYAYYMIGLAHFEQGKTSWEKYLPVDLSKRDLGIAKTSFNDFSTLVTYFPNSEYTPDARRRMVYLRNIMARYEINVANYYFEREAYLAAANRGKYVVENYPKTPAVADGLAVMVQAYTLLDLKQQANDALALLKANFPQHPSIAEDGTFKIQLTQNQAQRGWLNKASFGLFDNPTPPKFDNRTEFEK